MDLTINWIDKIVFVPKAEMILRQTSPVEIRELDITEFRNALKLLEGSESGIVFPDIHSNSPPLTIAGVTLARVLEIINGYTIQFENGQYLVNVVNGNSNLSDNIIPNSVSVRSNNSAGLVRGDGISLEDRQLLEDILNLIEADEKYDSARVTKYRKGTLEILLDKNVEIVDGGPSNGGEINITE